MESRIKGNHALIEKAKRATPQDTNIYINWEALQELPDQFEAVITAVKFDPQKLDQSFTNVGTQSRPSWMPNTNLMYEIAEAKGISGGDNSISESVYEEVDINPMLCKGFEDQPTYRRIKVGAKVVKFSTVLEEDGTYRRSSPCTQVYNVWDRCRELWSKEEKYTNGYTKSAGQYGYKYQTKFDRQAHLDSEMKFAMAKAETKAYTKTIRELAGLMTGYNTHDLAKGELLFAKIRKSSEALKLEQAAYLSSLSNGVKNDTSLLFGKTPDKEDDIKNVSETVNHEETPTLTPIEEAIKEAEAYLETGKLNPEMINVCNGIIDYLKRDPNADKGENWGPVTSDLAKVKNSLS